MKRTEKIEIRVSPAEKEALAAASRREGRTASDILREHVRSFLGAARAETDRKGKKQMTMFSKIAYLALGAGVGVPTAFFAATASDPDIAPAFGVHVELHGQDEAGDHIRYAANSRIPLARTAPTTMTMPIDEASSFVATVNIAKSDDGTYLFDFDICRREGETCAAISEPSLMTAFGSHSAMRVGAVDNMNVEINIQSLTE